MSHSRSIKRKFLLILFLCGLYLNTTAAYTYACRFWAAVTKDMSKAVMLDIVDDLLVSSNSLKTLGDTYDDGWAVGFYEEDGPKVLRGVDSSTSDPDYDHAVFEATDGTSKVVVAHLRKASSGCVEEVPNPHPFIRHSNGEKWLFGHNGTINKQILIDLIGEEYLDENAPVICTFNPPNSWIDSELYFIFLLKNIEEHKGNVQRGLRQGLTRLYEAIGEDRKALNFFLTDGKTIWAFRKGPSLYYYHQRRPALAAVSSEPPREGDDKWKSIDDGVLTVLKQGKSPKLIKLSAEN